MSGSTRRAAKISRVQIRAPAGAQGSSTTWEKKVTRRAASGVIVSAVALTVCLRGFATGDATAPFQVIGGQPVPNAAVRELRGVGATLVQAVKDRDVETILKYDRPDIRASDRSEFQDAHSEFHCFVFGRRCDPQRRPSVRDLIMDSRRLSIEVQVLTSPGTVPHGLLLFFNAASVDKGRLRSVPYLCLLSRRHRIVSWLFEWEGGHWSSAHPPFDFGTDTLCPAD